MSGAAVGVDLGKTGCRAVIVDGDVRLEAQGAGAPGLAEPNGVADVGAAIRAVLDTFGERHIASLAIGAAGAEAATGVSGALAELLLGDVTDSVAVASDAVSAHVGGLGGKPGTVLAVGTGTVALGVGPDGSMNFRGGWGPWLGDEGGGAWIGKMALHAVMSQREGRGPATSLTERAVARFGSLVGLPNAIHSTGGVARTMASFTPDVIEAADEGDAVASDVLKDAVAEWLDMTGSGADAAEVADVAVVGGLADVARLYDDFVARLPKELNLVPASGGSVDGALLLAQHRDLPHEASVLRME